MTNEQDAVDVGICPRCDSYLEFLEGNLVRCPNCGYKGETG